MSGLRLPLGPSWLRHLGCEIVGPGEPHSIDEVRAALDAAIGPHPQQENQR